MRIRMGRMKSRERIVFRALWVFGGVEVGNVLVERRWKGNERGDACAGQYKAGLAGDASRSRDTELPF